MTALLLLALVVLWYVARHRGRSRPGPGASAAARARTLRTPTVRIADALGIPTQRGAEAARYQAGAEGERRTAARLTPLLAEGWTILHDRALPTGRANVDHLAISPQGVVFLPDTKRWSARWPIRVVDGRLMHGDRDVTGRLRGLHHEARTVAAVLGVPVIPVVVMDGPVVHGREPAVDGIRIIPADRIRPELRTLAQQPGLRTRPRIAADAARLLPEYTRTRR